MITKLLAAYSRWFSSLQLPSLQSLVIRPCHPLLLTAAVKHQPPCHSPSFLDDFSSWIMGHLSYTTPVLILSHFNTHTYIWSLQLACQLLALPSAPLTPCQDLTVITNSKPIYNLHFMQPILCNWHPLTTPPSYYSQSSLPALLLTIFITSNILYNLLVFIWFIVHLIQMLRACKTETFVFLVPACSTMSSTWYTRNSTNLLNEF